MSDKREREKRKEARLAEESRASNEERRKKLLQFGAGAVFLVIVVVAVLIVVNASSGGGDSSNIEHAAEVNDELSGIPQQGLVLGDPKAPVELIEYGDLQCPVCKAFSEEVLPPVVEGKVKQGQAKLVFRNFTIIGDQSTPAGAAALAAGAQGRGWNYLDLFYRNQGLENSGYADDEFLTAVAKSSGVQDIRKWNNERKGPKFTKEVEKTTEEARGLGLSGTPSFAIKGPSTNGMEVLGTISSSEDLEAAIDAAS